MKSKKTALIKYLSGVAMLSLLLFVFACNQTDKEKETVDNDVIEEKIDPIEPSQIKTHELEDIDTHTDDDKVFTIVEENPEFPGGYSALQKFLSDNMKYPTEAQKKRIQGKVYVSFVVNKDGSISNVKVLRGVDSLLDKEAVRVVKEMPKWIPGKQRDEPVRVKFQIPIHFVLQ